MRELVYYVAASADGYIAGPSGQFDAFVADGDHMAYLIDRFPDALPTAAADAMGINQTIGPFGTVLMGRRTYEVGLAQGVDSPYRHLEQIVFSGQELSNQENLTIANADPLATTRKLKEVPGKDIWLCGGGVLAAQLAPEIDRLIIKRHPRIFGDGIPLFAPGGYAPRELELLDCRQFDSGVVVEEYRRKPV